MKIIVGKVLKAQGIKGEVKLGCALDDAKMLKKVKLFYIGANTYTVESLRFDGVFCYAKFAEVNDRNGAESLQNWDVYAEKDAINVPDGRYFIDDLVGCRVSLNNGNSVGKVTEVLQYGSADVIVCDGSKPLSFPFLKDLVISVDVESKVIVLDEKRFGEVAVYED